MLPWICLLPILPKESWKNTGCPPRTPIWSQGIVGVSLVRAGATHPLEVSLGIVLFLGLFLPYCKFPWYKCLIHAWSQHGNLWQYFWQKCQSIIFCKNEAQQKVSELTRKWLMGIKWACPGSSACCRWPVEPGHRGQWEEQQLPVLAH